MNVPPSVVGCVARPLVLALALAVAACSDSASPTDPSGTTTVSGVVLNPSTASAGSLVQATVNLTRAAGSGGAEVSITSSQAAVATVPTVVRVPAGASAVGFTITAGVVGTAMITATADISSASSMLVVIGAPALASISLSAPTVVGGTPVTGTVTLTSAAAAGGAMVSLSTADPATVPATVLVPVGLRSVSFEVATRMVGGAITATVSGTYGGESRSASLEVMPTATPAMAIAGFGVSGTNASDTCRLVDGGDRLECTFNGSSSVAPATIVEWQWTYSVETTITRTTTGPLLEGPPASCALVPPPPLAAGTTSFPLTVRLVIRDSLGNVSAEAVNTGARLLPQGACGF